MKKSCPNCKGTGQIIVDTKTCPECDGTGYEETINIKNHFKGINKKAKKQIVIYLKRISCLFYVFPPKMEV